MLTALDSRNSTGSAPATKGGRRADGDAASRCPYGDRKATMVAAAPRAARSRSNRGAAARAIGRDLGFDPAGGLGPRWGGAGRQKSFDAARKVSTAVILPDGQRFLNLEAPGQTVELQLFDDVFHPFQGGTTFIFTPGDAFDVVHGSKAQGSDHDAVSLSGASVHGSTVITDPVTDDARRPAGGSTAELESARRNRWVGLGQIRAQPSLTKAR